MTLQRLMRLSAPGLATLGFSRMLNWAGDAPRYLAQSVWRFCSPHVPIRRDIKAHFRRRSSDHRGLCRTALRPHAPEQMAGTVRRAHWRLGARAAQLRVAFRRRARRFLAGDLSVAPWF